MPNALLTKHPRRFDNSSAFISHKLKGCCGSKNISLQFNRLGTPTDNARIERFNDSSRRKLLDVYIFILSLKSGQWLKNG